MQALWMLLAAVFFSGMAVCVKFASAWFNSGELVFWRGLIGIAIMWAWARSRRVSLRTRYPGMHVWRSIVGVAGLGSWFYALSGLPLATAMTLNYMSSVWIAAFLVGGAMLSWRPREGQAVPPRQGMLAVAVLTGFAGVMLVLRPTLEQNQIFYGLVGLMSGLTAAFAYMQVMALARVGEPELRTVFYFAIGSTLTGAGWMAVGGTSSWDWQHAGWLLPIGVLASLGQLCMTRAYSHGATLVVANLHYSGIVFAALWGLLLFGERITLTGWAGMALIIASGIASTWLRARAVPDAPAEEH